jgi:hypothetical protein
MLFAVNGTLMRDLPLCRNLQAVGAKFVRETRTAPTYRLWSISDDYPGMLRVNQDGGSIELEVWDIDSCKVMDVFQKEPPGLCLGWVSLEDGNQVVGVLAEMSAIKGMIDITDFGGWRAYISRQTESSGARGVSS